MRKRQAFFATGRRRTGRAGAHEFRRRAMRRHALAHERAAQRPEGREKGQREGAGEIDRQGMDQQRAVQNVDPVDAHADVAGARGFIAFQRAGDLVGLVEIDAFEAIDQIGDVAQGQIQPLRADGRE